MMNTVILFDIDHTLFQTQKFWDSQLTEYAAHVEANGLLQSLQSRAILGIFSEGEKNLQMDKLQRTDLHKYFDDQNIHIFEKKMPELRRVLAQYAGKTVYLVDDKLTVLHEASTMNSTVKTIWVKQGFFAEKQESIAGFTPDYTVKNLEGLKNIHFSS